MREPVQGGQQPLRLGHQPLLVHGHVGAARRTQVHHEPPDDCGHGAVAPVGFRGQERLGPGGILERHPDAGVDRAFLVQGKELAQQG